MFDFLIRGGLLVDGTGGPSRHTDVGVTAGRVTALGEIPQGVESAEVLDARGYVVAPGFVDIHSHSDFTLLVDPRAMSSVSQGVTTEVVGNCGHGCAPIADPLAVRSNIYGYDPCVELNWRDMAGYLARLEEAGPAVNVATLVPNGNLRLAAMPVPASPARPDEVRAMVRLLDECLEAGAVGFSSGLEYMLENASSTDELTELCGIVAKHGGLYTTHTRNRGEAAIPAIEEQLRVADRANVPVQISHIVPRKGAPDGAWADAMEAVERARTRGCDAAFDMHTRLFGFSNLCGVLRPEMLNLPTERLAAELSDPEARQELRRYRSGLRARGDSLGWDRIRLYHSANRPQWIGRSFADLAPAGGDAFDAILNVLLADVEQPYAPMYASDAYEEEWLRATFRNPLCSPGSDATTLGTDGPLADAVFPGAFTWASWYFRRMVRETGELTLEDAICRMTSLAADRVGLKGRGRLVEGAWADVVIFDPRRFSDRATQHEPKRLAEGVIHVLVNGRMTLRDGKFTGTRAGAVLRGGKIRG